MLEKRDFWMVLLLTIVTCGIYSFIFIYQLTKDINVISHNPNDETDPTMAVVLSIVTCGLYSYYWYYAQGNKLKLSADGAGLPMVDTGTTYLLWLILGGLLCGLGYWVALYLFIKNYNLLVDAHNQPTYTA